MSTSPKCSRSVIFRLLALVSLLSVVAAVCLWADCLYRQCTWVHVSTTVWGHRLEEDLFNGGYKMYPAVYFTDGGAETHFFESQTGYAPADAPRQGSPFALIYPSGNPMEAQENTFSDQYALPTAVSVIALLCAALTLGLKRRRCRQA